MRAPNVLGSGKIITITSWKQATCEWNTNKNTKLHSKFFVFSKFDKSRPLSNITYFFPQRKAPVITAIFSSCRLPSPSHLLPKNRSVQLIRPLHFGHRPGLTLPPLRLVNEEKMNRVARFMEDARFFLQHFADLHTLSSNDYLQHTEKLTCGILYPKDGSTLIFRNRLLHYLSYRQIRHI